MPPKVEIRWDNQGPFDFRPIRLNDRYDRMIYDLMFPRFSYDIETNVIWDKPKGEKKMKNRGFICTKNTWVLTDGRETPISQLETPISQLETPHLCNIIEYLRGRAKEGIASSDTNSLYFKHPINYSTINAWLEEHCIAYPRLKAECYNRRIWHEEDMKVPAQLKVKDIMGATLKGGNFDKVKQILLDFEARLEKLEKVK